MLDEPHEPPEASPEAEGLPWWARTLLWAYVLWTAAYLGLYLFGK